MNPARYETPNATLMSLEAAAISARSGFACMFSTSDEYENALIAERRAQGRYARPRRNWPFAALAGVALMAAAGVVWLI